MTAKAGLVLAVVALAVACVCADESPRARNTRGRRCDSIHMVHLCAVGSHLDELLQRAPQDLEPLGQIEARIGGDLRGRESRGEGEV